MARHHKTNSGLRKLETDSFMQRGWDVFGPSHEANEFVLSVYRELGTAIRDHSDSLTLNRSALIHLSQGQVTSEFPMIYGGDPIYEVIKKSLIKIFERDSWIQEQFRLEQVDEASLSIIVNTSSQSTSTST